MGTESKTGRNIVYIKGEVRQLRTRQACEECVSSHRVSTMGETGDGELIDNTAVFNCV